MIDNNKELRELIRSRVGFAYVGFLAAVGPEGQIFICGSDEDAYLPEECESWKDITAISVAGKLTALKSDRTVVACYGDAEEYDYSDWTDIKKICSGTGVTYGIKKDGTVVGCGEFVKDDILGK